MPTTDDADRYDELAHLREEPQGAGVGCVFLIFLLVLGVLVTLALRIL